MLVQTLSNWQLIFIDDCSIDSSRTKIKSYADNDSRISYIFSKKNGGPARARNLGIDVANGEYIAFIDADDYVSPNFAETLYNSACINQADIVWCQFTEVINGNMYPIDCKLSRDMVYEKDEALKLFYQQVCGLGSLWNKVYRRSFINSNRIRINENRTRAEDWEFNLCAFQCIRRLKIIPDNLYYYVRDNNTSIMSSFREKDFDLMCSSSRLLEEINEKYGLEIPDGFDNNSNARFFLEYLLKGANESDEIADRITKNVINSSKFREVMRGCDIKNLPVTYKFLRAITKTKNVWFVKICCRLINKIKMYGL